MLPRRISTNAAYTPIGAMTSKIDILKRSTGRDANGEFKTPDVFAENLWAKIQFLTSKYTEKPQQVVSEATHKITMHFLAGVTSGMTVREGTAIYNIEGVPVDPDGRQVELWLYVYQRNDGAAGVHA